MTAWATRSFVLPPHPVVAPSGGDGPERRRRPAAGVQELAADAPQVVDVPGIGDGAGQPGDDVRGEGDDLAVFPQHALAAAPRAGDPDDLPPEIDAQGLTVVVTWQERQRLDAVTAGPEEGPGHELVHRRPGCVGEPHHVTPGVEGHRRVPALAAEGPEIGDRAA